jgi:hypothetical protein
MVGMTAVHSTTGAWDLLNTRFVCLGLPVFDLCKAGHHFAQWSVYGVVPLHK